MGKQCPIDGQGAWHHSYGRYGLRGTWVHAPA